MRSAINLASAITLASAIAGKATVILADDLTIGDQVANCFARNLAKKYDLDKGNADKLFVSLAEEREELASDMNNAYMTSVRNGISYAKSKAVAAITLKRMDDLDVLLGCMDQFMKPAME